jgi:hypothetical protein
LRHTDPIENDPEVLIVGAGAVGLSLGITPFPIASTLGARPVMPGKTKSSEATSFIRFRIASAGSDSGTRCCLPAFMRSAGTVHTAALTSISSHRAPRTSPERAAVRMRN